MISLLEEMRRDDGLLLRIENNGPFPAETLASIISKLNGAFDAFAKSKRNQATLGVVRVETGSIEILFAVIDTAKFLYEHRELAGAFAAHVAEAIFLLSSGSSKKVPAKTKAAVSAMANAVTADSARVINIINNTGTVIINQNNAQVIEKALAPPVREAPAIRYAADSMLTGRQIEQLEAGGLFGTAGHALDRWHARLEGGEGVLVPVSAAPDVLSELKDGQAYKFSGRVIQGRRGAPVGIQVDAAVPIG